MVCTDNFNIHLTTLSDNFIWLNMKIKATAMNGAIIKLGIIPCITINIIMPKIATLLLGLILSKSNETLVFHLYFKDITPIKNGKNEQPYKLTCSWIQLKKVFSNKFGL